jgi:energy-coupling factor transport system ATP-binding protein
VIFRYPSGVEALGGVDLTLASGERVAIIGRNGAGKSTLVRHFNGLLRPTQGRVLHAGEHDIARDTVAHCSRHVGIVFQDVRNQLFARTVRDELRFGPRNLGFPAERTDNLVNAALAALGLGDVADEHPYDLPPARRRLVAIAAVCTLDAPVLVLDEPTAGLDAPAMALIAALIRDQADRGRCVVVISHDIDFCADTTERVVLLQAGQIVIDRPWYALDATATTLVEQQVALPTTVHVSRLMGLPVAWNDQELLDFMA